AGEAKAIEMISQAAESFFQQRAEMSKRLDVLQSVLAQQTKFVVPAGSDLMAVLGLDDKSVPPIKKKPRVASRRFRSRAGRDLYQPRLPPAASPHRPRSGGRCLPAARRAPPAPARRLRRAH